MRITAFIICFLTLISLCGVHASRLYGARYQKLAGIAEDQKKYDYMLTYVIKGLQANLYNIDLYSYAGVAFMRLKQYELAKIYFNKYLKYNPNRINVLMNFAICCEQLKQEKEAFIIKKRIKRINPEYIRG